MTHSLFTYLFFHQHSTLSLRRALQRSLIFLGCVMFPVSEICFDYFVYLLFVYDIKTTLKKIIKEKNPDKNLIGTALGFGNILRNKLKNKFWKIDIFGSTSSHSYFPLLGVFFHFFFSNPHSSCISFLKCLWISNVYVTLSWNNLSNTYLSSFLLLFRKFYHVCIWSLYIATLLKYLIFMSTKHNF